MILCIGTTPAAQRVMVFRNLAVDAVNRAERTLDGAAGKSINVAKVLKTLGERPVATGFLGGDRGEELQSVLEAKGIEADFVKIATRTRQCITVIDESAGTQTELVEESQAATPADYEKLGSGDAFTASLVWRLLRGDDLGEASRWGTAAGTANALTLMPGEVNLADVERLVNEVEVERP